jgi:hypothetical protein
LSKAEQHVSEATPTTKTDSFQIKISVFTATAAAFEGTPKAMVISDTMIRHLLCIFKALPNVFVSMD